MSLLRKNNSVNHKLYLLSANELDNEWKFEIEGTTGNIYEITFGSTIQCTCPDFIRRKKICKHCYFIIGKILKDNQLFNIIEEDSNVNIFELRPNISEMINKEIKQKNKNKDQSDPDIKLDPDINSEPDPDNYCTICFDSFIENKISIKSCIICKNMFHNDCIKIWLKKKTNCPLCRSDWISFETCRDKNYCISHNGFEKFI